MTVWTSQFNCKRNRCEGENILLSHIFQPYCWTWTWSGNFSRICRTEEIADEVFSFFSLSLSVLDLKWNRKPRVLVQFYSFHSSLSLLVIQVHVQLTHSNVRKHLIKHALGKSVPFPSSSFGYHVTCRIKYLLTRQSPTFDWVFLRHLFVSLYSLMPVSSEREGVNVTWVKWRNWMFENLLFFHPSS